MNEPWAFDGDALTGQVGGVPFIALAPRGAREDVPTVVVWHMFDPPRSETAMAAALPLRGVDSWRVYLGLPLSGTRLARPGQGGY